MFAFLSPAINNNDHCIHLNVLPLHWAFYFSIEKLLKIFFKRIWIFFLFREHNYQGANRVKTKQEQAFQMGQQKHRARAGAWSGNGMWCVAWNTVLGVSLSCLSCPAPEHQGFRILFQILVLTFGQALLFSLLPNPSLKWHNNSCPPQLWGLIFVKHFAVLSKRSAESTRNLLLLAVYTRGVGTASYSVTQGQCLVTVCWTHGEQWHALMYGNGSQAQRNSSATSATDCLCGHVLVTSISVSPWPHLQYGSNAPRAGRSC